MSLSESDQADRLELLCDQYRAFRSRLCCSVTVSIYDWDQFPVCLCEDLLEWILSLADFTRRVVCGLPRSSKLEIHVMHRSLVESQAASTSWQLDAERKDIIEPVDDLQR